MTLSSLDHSTRNLPSSPSSPTRRSNPLLNVYVRTGDTIHHTGDTMHHTGDTMHHTGDTMHHTGDTMHHTGENVGLCAKRQLTAVDEELSDVHFSGDNNTPFTGGNNTPFTGSNCTPHERFGENGKAVSDFLWKFVYRSLDSSSDVFLQLRHDSDEYCHSSGAMGRGNFAYTPPPVELDNDDCVLMWEGIAVEMGEDVFELCGELIVSVSGVSDHLPQEIGKAIGHGIPGASGFGFLWNEAMAHASSVTEMAMQLGKGRKKSSEVEKCEAPNSGELEKCEAPNSEVEKCEAPNSGEVEKCEAPNSEVEKCEAPNSEVDKSEANSGELEKCEAPNSGELEKCEAPNSGEVDKCETQNRS
eukprot:CAMPEP_0113847436 /NCGR_PEP_ID=MMETSP0372-20130328/1872_1 /TAXON_ID=340204 /ORGANISM="Lankesteria abbotti" /LENGTH=357 /DNA_ID=CAMNT_0000816711 /DNA_START=331 /DNA_END=1404 /DNA_ORIENTATION=+ /assembly_acc=CAM_ASM_000359